MQTLIVVHCANESEKKKPQAKLHGASDCSSTLARDALLNLMVSCLFIILAACNGTEQASGNTIKAWTTLPNMTMLFANEGSKGISETGFIRSNSVSS